MCSKCYEYFCICPDCGHSDCICYGNIIDDTEEPTMTQTNDDFAHRFQPCNICKQPQCVCDEAYREERTGDRSPQWRFPHGEVLYTTHPSPHRRLCQLVSLLQRSSRRRPTCKSCKQDRSICICDEAYREQQVQNQSGQWMFRHGEVLLTNNTSTFPLVSDKKPTTIEHFLYLPFLVEAIGDDEIRSYINDDA